MTDKLIKLGFNSTPKSYIGWAKKHLDTVLLEYVPEMETVPLDIKMSNGTIIGVLHADGLTYFTMDKIKGETSDCNPSEILADEDLFELYKEGDYEYEETRNYGKFVYRTSLPARFKGPMLHKVYDILKEKYVMNAI